MSIVAALILVIVIGSIAWVLADVALAWHKFADEQEHSNPRARSALRAPN